MLGARGQPGGRAQEALPHLQLHSGPGCGKYSIPDRILRLCGRPAVESTPEDDYGWPGDSWTSGLPRDGGGGIPAHHFPQLAHRGLGPARCSCQSRIFLHRCSSSHYKARENTSILINFFSLTQHLSFLWVYFSEMFSTDPVPARVTSLCERVHATIVLLSHDVVDRTTWTKLGLLKK